MKKYWITENFRGRGYWTEEPNIAKAIERHGDEAIAITFSNHGVEYSLILYPDAKFHITAGDVEIELQYDRRIRKWYYAEGENRFLLLISRDTISNILLRSREMLHYDRK